jgi:hypothetical protein
VSVSAIRGEAKHPTGDIVVHLDYMNADEDTFDLHPSDDSRTIRSVLYFIFKYRSGTLPPQVFSWRAQAPRLSFVTRTASIGGMIVGTSCLRCTLSTMRWTET